MQPHSLAIVLVFCLYIYTSAATSSLRHGNHSRSLLPALQVALYEDMTGWLNWQHPEFQSYVNTCPVPCKLLVGRSPNTDVIVLNAMRYGKTWNKNTRVRTARNEKVVIFSMEQPKYAAVLNDLATLRQADMVATYVQDHTFDRQKTVLNFPLTYFPLHLFSVDIVLKRPLSFTEKDGFGTGVSIVAFVSNCRNAGASQRMEYMKELMQHIEVHNYGNCLNTRQGEADASDIALPHLRRRVQKLRTLQRYKFYLAFENDLVQDYVSEKLYDGFIAGSVPVYRGSPTIDGLVPAADSVINAHSMPPRELATLLQGLSQDEQQYNKYLEYKNRPLSHDFVTHAMRSYAHPNVVCRMCHYFTHGSDPTDDYETAMKVLSMEQLPSFKVEL